MELTGAFNPASDDRRSLDGKIDFAHQRVAVVNEDAMLAPAQANSPQLPSISSSSRILFSTDRYAHAQSSTPAARCLLPQNPYRLFPNPSALFTKK